MIRWIKHRFSTDDLTKQTLQRVVDIGATIAIVLWLGYFCYRVFTIM